MALPEHTTTIEKFIESGIGSVISYPALSFTNMLPNGTMVSIHNVISDYIQEFRNASVDVVLTAEQQFIYYYKPKLLCHDVYGNPELYFIILLINDMADVKEFTKPIIKMPKKDHMSQIISLIYNSEKKPIEEYNNK